MSNTHPSTPRRIELARRHARLIGPPGTGERNKERYLDGIDGLVFGDQGNDGVIRDKRFSHAKLGIMFSVPEQFELINRDDAVLASGPNETAVRFDAETKGMGFSTPVTYLKSGWVNGLVKDSVRGLTINGLPAARAEAVTGDWKFVVTVIELQRRFYRFIMAAPKSAPDIVPVSNTISESFRQMTDEDRAALKPLRIKMVKVQPLDTVASLSQQMSGVSRKEILFRSLNGLGENDPVAKGSRVKIIVD